MDKTSIVFRPMNSVEHFIVQNPQKNAHIVFISLIPRDPTCMKLTQSWTYLTVTNPTDPSLPPTDPNWPKQTSLTFGLEIEL